MSRRSYSKHIPDFRLVTHFGESGNSMIHSMSLWTKAGLLAIVVCLATVLIDPILISILYITCLAFYLAAKLPFKVLLGWYTLPAMFVFTLAIMFIFTEPGDEVIGVDLFGSHIQVTDNGIVLMYKLLIRALAVVTFSLALFMSSRYSHIAYLARRMMPRTLATVFLLSYRFLFVTSDEVTDVIDAIHSRNGGLIRGVSRQTRLFAGIFGLAFIHAFERAERIAKAMESRGFTGDMPVMEHAPRPSVAGVSVVTVGVVVLAISVYIRYFDSSMIWW
ncbi:MAG: energy-coupling factor transporter transmembrane protein EcfT [Candidatus Thermoplasmatota archaeon]|nr:energy-coupling factor transporter transmembrane protein EcfT [Candidatus Thermoplasmatota archaeon]